MKCSVTVSDGGSGTGTGNPVVVGKVYKEDGSPASEARVVLRRTDFLKDTSLAQLKDIYIDSADTFTDNEGVFCFNSVDTGQYYIEVATGESLAVLLECKVLEDDSIVSIPDETLSPMGNITGNVSLHGGPEAKRFVQVYGLDRVVETDAAGNFQIDVPEGEYKLRVVMGTSEYKEVNILNVKPEIDPVSIMVLSENPISDSWECDTLIVRAILDSNNMQSYSATYFITIIDNGRAYQLDLESSLLFTMPSILGGLHTLRELEIQLSSISSLPERIGELVDLVELELNDNRLTTLPIEITNIIKLTELRLSRNKLKNLPPAVKYWADRFDPDWADSQDTTIADSY